MNTAKLIRRFNRGCKGFFLVTFLLLIGDMASYLLPPFFQQVYTDNIITHKNPEWFTPLIIFYGLLFVLELFIWLLLNPLRRREFAKLGITSSSRYVLNLLKLPMGAIDRFSAGELVARYSSIKNIGTAMDHFSYALVLVLRPIVCAWLLVMYSWKLGLVVLLSMILLVVVMRTTASTIKKRAKGSEETDARLQGVTMTGIKNMETIKSMGGERIFYSKWEETYVKALNARVKTTMGTMSIGSLPLLVLNLCNALILCLGAWYILQGELTPGMLLASQALATSITFPINSVVSSTQEIYRSHAAMERLEEVEAASEGHTLTLSDTDALPDCPKLRGEVELRNVTFGYDRNNPPVLKNFSLKIAPGERVAFVGFSGCGKSTIAKLISGLYEPWEGDVLLDGAVHFLYRNAVQQHFSFPGLVQAGNEFGDGALSTAGEAYKRHPLSRRNLEGEIIEYRRVVAVVAKGDVAQFHFSAEFGSLRQGVCGRKREGVALTGRLHFFQALHGGVGTVDFLGGTDHRVDGEGNAGGQGLRGQQHAGR